MRLILVFAVAALVPSVAASQTRCPTASDLSKGIRVDRSGGFTEVFRQGGQGIIAVDGSVGGELEYRLELAYGLQLLSYTGNVGDTPVTDDGLLYDYGVPVGDLPAPVPGGRWQSEVTVTSFGGTYQEPQLYGFGPASGILIGDCQYAMIEVTIAYQNDANYFETVQFLPDLGIGVLVRQDDDISEPTVFTIDRIGIARQ